MPTDNTTSAVIPHHQSNVPSTKVLRQASVNWRASPTCPPNNLKHYATVSFSRPKTTNPARLPPANRSGCSKASTPTPQPVIMDRCTGSSGATVPPPKHGCIGTEIRSKEAISQSVKCCVSGLNSPQLPFDPREAASPRQIWFFREFSGRFLRGFCILRP